MRKSGKIAISMLLILVILSGIIKSLAVNFELNVKFDGKNISMESETPDMNWDLDNLLPGQSDVSSINIKNSGKKEVDLETSINIEEDTGLLEKIELTVTNNAGDTVFTGKYKDLKKITKRLKVGETEKYTVSTKLSVDAGNEYQDKKYKLKFNFNAIGSISVGKLTIKYVDEEGNDIEPPTVETKEITNKYDLPTVGKNIDGYKFVEVEGPTSGEYKEEGTTVIYHYKKITYNKLTVKYVSDTENGKILKQIQETKETGTEYKYTPEQFEGYEYTGVVDGEPEGTFGKEDKEIIFHYKKVEEIKTGKVIIIYIDEDNNVLEKDENTDTVGKNYEYTIDEIKKEIPGYKFVEVDGKLAGEYKEEDTIIYCKYKKIKRGRLIVVCIDTNNEIIKRTITVEEVGTDYNLGDVGEPIDGYTFLGIEGEPVGKYKIEDTIVLYRYKKNGPSTSDVKLPKTGDTVFYYVIGGTVVLLILIFVVIIKKRKDKDEKNSK